MKAYKYKLKPSKHISKRLEKVLDGCRELYNAGMQERRSAYKTAGVSVCYLQQANQLPEIKQLRPEFAQIHAQVLQDALRRLNKSFEAFFNCIKKGAPAGYPRFKARSRYNSFTYPQAGAKGGYRVVGNKLHLSKIGKIKLRFSRPIEGAIKTCTIKREADGWYVIFSVEENHSRFFPKTGKTTGVDVGIENFAVLSDGRQIENPQYLRKAERRLKTAQRSVSRKTSGGRNRKKAARLLAKQHLKVKRQRKDFHYKRSLELIQEFDQLTFEDLNISGMMKNHHLAKSIADASWNAFISICEAKAGNAGRRIVKVAAAFSSQDCSQCGARVRKTLSQREHRCIACGLVLHRDHNSAVNLDQRGRAASVGMGEAACPDELRTYPV